MISSKWFQSIDLSNDLAQDAIPPCEEGQTIFEWVPDWTDKARPWKKWEPDEWKAPKARARKCEGSQVDIKELDDHVHFDSPCLAEK